MLLRSGELWPGGCGSFAGTICSALSAASRPAGFVRKPTPGMAGREPIPEWLRGPPGTAIAASAQWSLRDLMSE